MLPPPTSRPLRGRLTVFTVIWLVLGGLALWTLEGARAGVEVTRYSVGQTPVIRYAADLDGPDIVVAHGFAGSAQIMQAYSLALARAGYDVHAFDFEGHGRHPVPMSGDVTSVEGTTRLLVDQTEAVMAAAGDAPALLGHSMATDVLVRAAGEVPTGPLVLLSAFSGAVTETHPQDALFLVGAGEGRLIDFLEEASVRLRPETGFNETEAEGDTIRRAVVLPWIEHVSILHSRVGVSEAVAWIDRAYGRESRVDVPWTGPALLLLLFAIVALIRPLARLVPAQPVIAPKLPPRRFAAAVIVPTIVAPLIAVPLYRPMLPVLVADYVALHLFLFGLIQAALLWRFRRPVGRMSLMGAVLLVVWGLGAFGLALDRYGANFLPIPERLPVIAALALGTVPFMLTDAVLTQGASVWQRLGARTGIVVSLGLAVLLDLEGLFFLALIAPVIVLFYLVFGTMGRAVSLRAGPLPRGVALGLILAWALGTSFPMFAA